MANATPVSVSAFRAGSERERKRIAADAIAEYGKLRYLCVVDHGIDLELVAQLPSIAAPFFALPLATKLDYLARSGLGYLPSPDSLNLPVSGNPNAPHEQLIVHLDETRNPWPCIPPEFREVVSAYNRAAERLCRTLVWLVALAVDVPPAGILEEDNAPNSSFLKFIAWRKQERDTRTADHRLAPHHDNAAVSVLNNAHRPNGLQVLNGDGWVEAYSDAGALVVFLGEQLTQWTDGRVTPTWHRVVNECSDYAGDGSRLSSCYFYNPEPMVEDVERYLAGRAKYCEACDAALRGEVVTKQTWTRRFRWTAT